MSLRDEVEALLRSWDAYERARDAPAIIDFDCHPTDARVKPSQNRLDVLRRFTDLRAHADQELRTRIDSHIAYLRALMGERLPLDEYTRMTQGCAAAGWPREHVAQVG